MRCVQEPGNTCCLDCGGGVGGEGRAGVCVCVWGGGWVKAAFIIVYMYFSFYRGPLIKL